MTRTAFAAAMGLAALLGAQTAGATTRFALEGGFMPDPWSVDTNVDVVEPAGELVHGCPGFAAADGIVVTLNRPSSPLQFFATGGGLVGLIVVGPDGIYRCTGLDAAGVAALRVDPLLEGEHRVLPLGAEPGEVALRLLVSELALDADARARALGLQQSVLAASAEPAFGRHRLPNAAEGVTSLPLTLSAAADASSFGEGCYGRIDPTRPDVLLRLDASERRIVLRARSDSDTTLVVHAPDGRVHCDDDSYGHDPEVVLTDTAAGDYAIWIGLYSGQGGEAATLDLSRGAERGELPAALDATAPPAAGTHVLAGTGQLAIDVALAPLVRAEAFSSGCAGSIDPSRPDAVILLDAEAPLLALRAQSATDTTLFLRLPDGGLICDDDTDGLNPALQVAPASSGDYSVWVGAYSASEGGTAVLEAALGRATSAPSLEAILDRDPFGGRAPASAAQALEILMAQGLSEQLAYDRLEPLGADGLLLENVLLSDPSDPFAKLRVTRLLISDLDLEGLASGEPDRFRIEMEGIDYAALLATAGAGDLLPVLPSLGDGSLLSASASLLPPAGSPDSRDFAVSIDLERQFAFRLAGRFDLAPRDGVRPRVDDAPTQAITLEFENLGFIGQMIRAQAAETGMEPQQLIAMLTGGLAETLGPTRPGSPQALLVETAKAALADGDQRGVIRLHLATDEPRGLEAIFEDLKVAGELDERLKMDLRYEPMP
jgi:hypothetical protein